MLKVYDVPKLHDPVLLCAFSGWADAAFAATGALRYLNGRQKGQIIAEFDADEVYVYTITRPVSSIAGPGQRTLRWPHMRWVAQVLPGEAHDLVLLTGPEPDQKWQACVQDLAQFAQRLGILQVVTYGAFYATVPYAGPPLLIGYSNDPEWQAQLGSLNVQDSNYEGPTGFLGAVYSAMANTGARVAGVWAAAPNYLPGTNNPKLAAHLLGITEALLRQPIAKQELEIAGREMEKQIEEAIRTRPDLVELINKLGGGQELINPPAQRQEPRQEQPPEPEELPSAEEVLRDLEEHLRRMRRQPPEGQ